MKVHRKAKLIEVDGNELVFHVEIDGQKSKLCREYERLAHRIANPGAADEHSEDQMIELVCAEAVSSPDSWDRLVPIEEVVQNIGRTFESEE